MTFEEYLSSLKGKTVGVIGVGVSNRPLIEKLLERGIDVTARDKKEDLGELGQALTAQGCKLRLGSGYLADLHEDVIFRTPGLRPDVPELAAAVAGFLVSGYLLLCENRRLSNGFRKISAAALITLVCILGCHLLDTEASHAIIGTLMILTPGIAFTMGIRDFVQGDYLSGTIRMIDALLIAASIAIGTGLVLSLTSLLTGVTVV